MRAFGRLGLIGSAILLVGCYTLQPTGGVVPQTGTEIGLDINDAGRVALGGTMGPLIRQIEGRLVSKDTSEYVIAVTGVHLLDGGDQVWRGEAVHIKNEYVTSLYERRFSVGRTVALGAVGVGAIAILGTRSLTGLGSPDRGDGTPGDTAQARRIPRP